MDTDTFYRLGEWHSITALLADRDEATVYLKVEAVLARLHALEAEVAILEHGCIIEIAVRNKSGSVSDYMNHWEGRALKAEARLSALRTALEKLGEKWRWSASFYDPETPGRRVVDVCAGDLAAVLRTQEPT